MADFLVPDVLGPKPAETLVGTGHSPINRVVSLPALLWDFRVRKSIGEMVRNMVPRVVVNFVGAE